MWCRYALNNWNVFKACMRREFIIMKRNSIVFGFRIIQVSLLLRHTHACMHLHTHACWHAHTHTYTNARTHAGTHARSE